jgi:hypothetical protein
VRPRRAVKQDCGIFLKEATHPPIRALTGHAEFSGNMGRFATADKDAVNQQLAAMNRQPGISVGHEDLRV